MPNMREIHCKHSLGGFSAAFSMLRAAERLLAWLCTGFPPQHPPVAAKLHPDTRVCMSVVQAALLRRSWRKSATTNTRNLLGTIVLKICGKSLTSAEPLTLPSALLLRVSVLDICSTGPLYPLISCCSSQFAPYFPYEFVWFCVLGSLLHLPSYANKSPNTRPFFLL